MTDARFPERWLNDRRIMRLSPAAFRLFVVSLAWSASNRTDGQIDHDDLPLIPVESASILADELASSGLWAQQLDGSYSITVYGETQLSKAQLDALDERYRKDRERKRIAKFPAEPPQEPPQEGRAEFARSGQVRSRSVDVTEPQSYMGNGSAPTVRFDDFYDVYPRHVGRGAAVKAWASAVKRAPAAQIVTAAQRLADDPNLPDKQFIPHPATWLNQDRWLDDPLPARRGGADEFRGVSTWETNT